MRIDDMQYAQSGAISIAWQRYGNADGVPVVAIPPLATSIEVTWEYQPARHSSSAGAPSPTWSSSTSAGAARRIASTGPPASRSAWTTSAVMDAAGIDRAALYALSEGGPMGMLFAATYPERVSALVLHGTFACARWHPDYAAGAVDPRWRHGPWSPG